MEGKEGTQQREACGVASSQLVLHIHRNLFPLRSSFHLSLSHTHSHARILAAVQGCVARQNHHTEPFPSFECHYAIETSAGFRGR